MSSSANSGVIDSSRRHKVDRDRGIPMKCRCGEGSVIRTSETPKNPGRLFYCCLYGSKEEKGHLFKWTDIAVVEEIEEIESVVEKIQVDMGSLETRTCEVVANNFRMDNRAIEVMAQGCQKEFEELKTLVTCCEKEIQELRSFKNMTVCGLFMVLVYFFVFAK